MAPPMHCDRRLPLSSLLMPSGAERGQVSAALLDARETGVLSAERLQTGCIYEGRSQSSYGIAVMRFDPRRSGRRMTPIHASWPDLAPSVSLLNGYRRMDAHGQRQLQWPDFAARYLAELGRVPAQVLLAFLDLLNTMPCRYTTVTLLCCEHATAGDERLVRCHRRLLKSWLLGTTPTLADIAACKRQDH
jgi:uncharacterized protein YeaO (DUF488 family)